MLISSLQKNNSLSIIMTLSNSTIEDGHTYLYPIVAFAPLQAPAFTLELEVGGPFGGHLFHLRFQFHLRYYVVFSCTVPDRYEVDCDI